jgi:hypothetical protein
MDTLTDTAQWSMRVQGGRGNGLGGNCNGRPDKTRALLNACAVKRVRCKTRTLHCRTRALLNTYAVKRVRCRKRAPRWIFFIKSTMFRTLAWERYYPGAALFITGFYRFSQKCSRY